MSKFLSLVEEFNPQNTEDPKWKLIEFLRGKGIKISASDDSDNFQIRTEEGDIMVCVMNQEEEAEGIQAGYGQVNVMDRINKMSDEYRTKGIGGKIFNPTLRQADAIRKKAEGLNKQFIPAGQAAVRRLEQDLRQIRQNSTSGGQNVDY
jgi:hypothetical protein